MHPFPENEAQSPKISFTVGNVPTGKQIHVLLCFATLACMSFVGTDAIDHESWSGHTIRFLINSKSIGRLFLQSQI